EGGEGRSRGTSSRGMVDQLRRPNVAALRKLEASLQFHLLEQEAMACAPVPIAPAPTARDLLGPDYRRVHLWHWWLRLRKMTYVARALGGVMLLAMLLLWQRLERVGCRHALAGRCDRRELR